MIAALQMYDWPEVHGRNDMFWSRIKESLQGFDLVAPTALSRPDALQTPWTAPDLLLGQTCGLPYVSGRAGEAVILGRPSYGVPGTSAGTYRSALICRLGDEGSLTAFQGARGAINEFGSQSGCNALADAILDTGHPADRPFFDQLIVSGGHRFSALSVANGKADVAAIDAVSWALFAEAEPAAHAKLHVFGWSAETPSLPFITAPKYAHHRQTFLNALQSAASQTSWAEIGLPIDVLPGTDADYQPIRDMDERVRGMRLAPDTPCLGAET